MKKKDIDTVLIICKMRVARETFGNNLVKEQKKQLTPILNVMGGTKLLPVKDIPHDTFILFL